MNRLITLFIFSLTFAQVFNTSQGTEYSTIGEALQNVNSGDTIQVSPGIYTESISIETSINLEGSPGAIIDASNESHGISIKDSNISVSGFEITGNENTISGIAVNPGSINITISDNIIHGMGLANYNESPLSYGIIVWGNEVPPNPPINITIDNNEIYNISGSGISLGEITQNITITNNYIHDINGVVIPENIVPDQNLTSIGINGFFANNVNISGNTLENLTAGISLGISSGTITGNIYNNVDVFFASFFFNTASEDDFEYNESVSYWRSSRDVQNILSMHSYCSNLQLAQDTSDDGGTILTSNGEQIIQDCNNVWGGEDLPICETCETDYLGDTNLDSLVDILDVILIINNILLESTTLTNSQECLSDLDFNTEVNILDVVILVQSILS